MIVLTMNARCVVPVPRQDDPTPDGSVVTCVLTHKTTQRVFTVACGDTDGRSDLAVYGFQVAAVSNPSAGRIFLEHDGEYAIQLGYAATYQSSPTGLTVFHEEKGRLVYVS